MGVAGDDYQTFMDGFENSKSSRSVQVIASKPKVISANDSNGEKIDKSDAPTDGYSSQYSAVDGTTSEGSNFEYSSDSYEEYAADETVERTDLDENAYSSRFQYVAVDGIIDEESSFYVDGTAVDGINFEYGYDSSSQYDAVDGIAEGDTFEYGYDEAENNENIVDLANSIH